MFELPTVPLFTPDITSSITAMWNAARTGAGTSRASSEATSTAMRDIGPPSKRADCPCVVCPSTDFSSWSRTLDRQARDDGNRRSEEHTSELQSHSDLVCRLLLEKKKTRQQTTGTARAVEGWWRQPCPRRWLPAASSPRRCAVCEAL